ncbi:MAG: class I SAM-dependent methyltransferase [Bacteriovoracaceae bacterium]
MSTDLIAHSSSNYSLLDSGHEQKLEKIGNYVVIRSSPQAIGKPKLNKSEWISAYAEHVRKKDGGGFWDFKKNGVINPFSMPLEFESTTLKVNINFTPFGHCGVFFEQLILSAELGRMINEAKKKSDQVRVINLFAYTGVASLLAASLGAEVYHVDSAKSILTWASDNLKINPKISGSIKFIHEDAVKFLKANQKKKGTFDIILADPPSWGHGAGKEKWDFNLNICELVELGTNLLKKDSGSFFLTTHTPGVQHNSLKNLLEGTNTFKFFRSGDIGIKHSGDERILPTGIYSIASS